MMHYADLFLAWKYFKPKRSAVSVITLISVIGVALGVGVLIVVLAVMTGFSDKMKEKLAEGKATVMNNVSKAKGRLTFERNMDERKGVKLATLQKMSETIVESLKNKLMDEKYANQLLETLENEKVNLKTDNKKSYKSVFRMVKRNPGAVSRSHSAELDEIKKLIK